LLKKQDALLLALTILLCIVCAIFYIFYYPGADSTTLYPDGSFVDSGTYQFNPETALDAIDRGNVNVFLSSTGIQSNSESKPAVFWGHAQFLKAASAIFQFRWGESQNTWNSYRIFFRTKCQDYSIGFDYADFIYFKEISLNGRRLYTAREISIDLTQNEIYWGGNTNFPRSLFGWKSIQTEKITTTAEKAVLMAEERGGSRLRLLTQNQCYITVQYFPENYDYNGWRISYGEQEFILIPVK
jgi:hypothetical protein